MFDVATGTRRYCAIGPTRRYRGTAAMASAAVSPRYLQDVDGREEADPDHVDEVPVDRRGFDGEMAMRVELPLQRAPQDDDEEEHAAGHVRAMEAGEAEEDPAEEPGLRDEVLAVQLRVLDAE